MKEYNAAWQRRNKDKISAKRFRSLLKTRYGIDENIYQAILETQGGRCAICRNLPTTKRLAVDHDHETGLKRGLLCDPCNKALGFFRDSRTILQAALAYIDKSTR